MNARRAARSSTPGDGTASGFPNKLAAGPCIEDWADEPEEDWANNLPGYLAHSARRNWARAVAAWAQRTGRDPFKARELARTQLPWSRDYLRNTGRGGWADYYDGKRKTRPTSDPSRARTHSKDDQA